MVTGGAGFVGSNLVRGLNARGQHNIVVVDDLSDGTKFRNLVDCDIADYCDAEEFRRRVDADNLGFEVTALLHQGACADTTVWDGRFMLDVNYTYSQDLYRFCCARNVPFIYASSAAVYGLSEHCVEEVSCEAPLNVYGYSKLLFDRWVRLQPKRRTWQTVGLRYFNVYGPGEAHKGPMASIVWQLQKQMLESGTLRLFAASGGYGDGEQRRDFVFVDDLVDVTLWFLEHRDVSGIFNLGTGVSQSFNDVARALISHHGRGTIEYIPFPEHLRGAYQHFTQADLTHLRAQGCDHQFADVERGVQRYLQRIAQPSGIA